MKKFAGVIPYAFDRLGNVMVLLSREAFGGEAGRWSGFAGRYDRENETTLDLATRECFEESMGLFGSPGYIKDMLQTRGRRVEVTFGTHYLLPVPYNPELPEMFQGVRQMYADVVRNPRAYTPFIEKDALLWVQFTPDAHVPPFMKLRNGFKHDLMFIQKLLKDRYTS